MLKLLFIDDKPDSFESLKNFLRQQRLNFEGETHNFPKARNRVAGYRSDIVILDLADAASLENLEAEAKDTLDLFWKEHFYMPPIPASLRRFPRWRCARQGNRRTS